MTKMETGQTLSAYTENELIWQLPASGVILHESALRHRPFPSL